MIPQCRLRSDLYLCFCQSFSPIISQSLVGELLALSNKVKVKINGQEVGWSIPNVS